MRVPVAILPSPLVSVAAAGWHELVQDSWQVMLQARLELNCPDGSSAADVENVDRTGSDARGPHNRRNLLGEVVHVTVPCCLQGNLLLIVHNLEPCRWGVSLARPIPVRQHIHGYRSASSFCTKSRAGEAAGRPRNTTETWPSLA